MSPAEDSRHALLRAEIALPFLLVALIWGSTWYAIKDQLADAPPVWSVTYRFAIASAGMFALAAWGRRGFGLTRAGHWLALAVGFTQFFLNYNLVYEAEIHLTSGVVAVPFTPDGASFTAVTSTLIVRATGSRSTPPFAVPPPSWTWNVKLT